MRPYVELIRPHQWLKNLMLLFPPFLGGTLLQLKSPGHLLLPLVSFSAAASSIYIVNDLFDSEQDRLHPRKRHRPLPAGRIGRTAALIEAVMLGGLALLCGWLVSVQFLFFVLLYLSISTAYSWYLKKIPLVELFCVVSGFLLRLLAGGNAYGVAISDWLFLSVFLLALYLVCGKRLSELRHEGGGDPSSVRPVLALYPAGFLEGGMFMSGASVLVTYTMYVISHHSNLWLIPLCCFGLLVYLLRVMSGQGGDPTRALLKDPLIFLVGLVWLLTVCFGIYGV